MDAVAASHAFDQLEVAAAGIRQATSNGASGKSSIIFILPSDAVSRRLSITQADLIGIALTLFDSAPLPD